jgi:hypothetical protein
MTETDDTRVARTITIPAETDRLLRQWGNASEYVTRVLALYPPPEYPRTLDALGELVRQRHPWACLVGSARPVARLNLPNYGGDEPDDPEAVSWDRLRIMTRGGDIRPRHEA